MPGREPSGPVGTRMSLGSIGSAKNASSCPTRADPRRTEKNSMSVAPVVQSYGTLER
jgi:hypothetical protein